MIEEKDEAISSDEDEKVDTVETDETETSEEEAEKKDDFEKDSETVSVGRLNQAIRKQREAELKTRELEKALEEAKKPTKKSKEEDEEDDDFDFDEEKSKKKDIDIESLVDAKVKPVLERLSQREAEEKKNQRTAFFKKYPQYLTDSEKWQELLDEVDNFNPNSKDGYYKQLVKGHRIISAEEDTSSIDRKKKEMAADSASKGDGSQKAADRKSAEDERADRLAKRMPIGFTYTGK
jgi:hypothetical protein